MSYSSKIKTEIFNCSYDKDEKVALLSAIVRNTTFTTKEINITTENVEYARFIIKLFKEALNKDLTITVRKNYNFSKNTLYLLKINKEVLLTLHTLSIVDFNGTILSMPKAYIINDEKMRRAYIKGVFLSSGSIVDPKSNYHAEMVFDTNDYAMFVKLLLSKYQIGCNIMKRKRAFMLYVKQADKISDFLKVLDAPRAVIYFEEVRVYKEQMNIVNRINNCEQANVERSMNAALAQVKDIEYIEKYSSLDSLDEKTRLVCIYRKKYIEASLEDLANIINEENNMKFTKSAINHKFRKIRSLKLSLMQKQEDE